MALSLGRPAGLTAGVAVAAAIMVASLSGCTGGPPVVRGPDLGSIARSRYAPGIPARGAYFGAWVRPQSFSQAGQIEAIERAVEADNECARVLQQATSCRGALDGFIAEVIEDHVREHMIDPAAPRDDPRTLAAEELVEIVHAYLT